LVDTFPRGLSLAGGVILQTVCVPAYVAKPADVHAFFLRRFRASLNNLFSHILSASLLPVSLVLKGACLNNW
jgi:hypothetical protein